MKSLIVMFACLLPLMAARGQEAPPAAAPAADPPARAGQFKTMDRLELDSTAITGNQELPKVMFIVPWKKADLGEMSGRPAKSLLDEVLEPVDRDVFRREVGFHQALAGSRGAPPAQAEKSVTPLAPSP